MTLQLAQPGVSDEKSFVRSAAANHPRGWLETLKPKDVMNQTTTRIFKKKVSTSKRDLTQL